MNRLEVPHQSPGRVYPERREVASARMGGDHDEVAVVVDDALLAADVAVGSPRQSGAPKFAARYSRISSRLSGAWGAMPCSVTIQLSSLSQVLRDSRCCFTIARE